MNKPVRLDRKCAEIFGGLKTIDAVNQANFFLLPGIKSRVAEQWNLTY